MYVDDILVLGKNLELINKLKIDLSKELETTDLGEASFFLGIEIIRNRQTKEIWLKQLKYIKNMLEKYNKQYLNPISTPAELGIKLEKNKDIATLEDINLF